MDIFVCSDCGNETTKWSGRCPSCGAWNTMRDAGRIIGKGKKRKSAASASVTEAEPFAAADGEMKPRARSGIGELDTVLGGGVVPGMAVLVGGEPGIGKSTLMLQMASRLASAKQPALYVSGEESAQQIRLRGLRLGIETEELFLLCSGNLQHVEQEIARLRPGLLVIDSIQAMQNPDVESAPGSMSQMRECTARLVRLAKDNDLPTFLVGHVTKEGMVAGPRIVEHMVDTVLYFEGEGHLKILRAQKNRFGSTNEIGVFEMRADGLHEIADPSGIFLHGLDHAPGVAVGGMMEGSRAFLVEVQSLVTPASYGTPQRVSIGYDPKRLSVALAVLEKFLAINLRQHDVFLNLAGGLRTRDPALDLAVAAAVVSGFRDKPLPRGTVLLGELGLGGEVRPVSQAARRVNEAAKLGFKRVLLSPRAKASADKLEIVAVEHLSGLFAAIDSGVQR
ncbi:MAG: DNA repair protein RadA [Candidatus Cloacimonetes bacterium]|nr:DNA repair protein RadA [Candidatus Cloacimonadota bacterium]